MKEVEEPTLRTVARQRPDIQFWVNISEENDLIEAWKFFNVEIAVSFGKGDREDEQENLWKRVLDFKTNKYTPLIRSLKAQLRKRRGNKRFEVEFLSFIISSRVTMSNKSISNLTKMIGTATKKTISLWERNLL
jgi:hypothetical protein